MDLSELRTIVRCDLRDEDTSGYRWTDDELDRHIGHAVRDFSEESPREQLTSVGTVAGSREMDIGDLSDRIAVIAVEYPINRFPRCYQRFSLWGDTLTLLGQEVPDGSDCRIYYGSLHTLDTESSTVPETYRDIIAAGAAGYAAVARAGYAIDRVNVGGTSTAGEFLAWGQARLQFFRDELKRLGRRNRVRSRTLYRPHYQPVSKTTDYGP
jgi:hypothetical protein